MLPGHRTLRLTPAWQVAGAMVVASKRDAVGLCHEGAWVALPSRQGGFEFDWANRVAMSDLRYFVAECSETRFVARDLPDQGDEQVLALVRQAILEGALLVLRQGGEGSTRPAPPEAVKLRQLVRDVEKATHGKLAYRGRQYKLVLGDDLVALPGRDAFEVVGRDEARAVLDGVAKASGGPAEPLHVAGTKLSKDWRPPLSPEGLVLLRRITVVAAAARDDSPAITPSEMKALLDAASDTEPQIRLVDIEAPVFVPGVETTKIGYAIDGPVAKVAAVKMIVKSVPPKGAPSVVQSLAVDGPYAATGALDWDGKALTPGGFITLKGSPYEVAFELTSKSGRISTSNTGNVGLQVQETKIVVDDTGPLAVEDDWKSTVAGFIGELKKSGMPSDCEGRVLIESPLFKLNDAAGPLGDMYSDASFATYEAAAETGPALPFLVHIELQAKDGTGKRCPPALLGTRVLWDFELETSAELEASLGARGVAPAAKAFMKKVGGYEEAATQPKGASTHVRVGGLRAKTADRTRAGRQWQAGDGWAMALPGQRDWATFTGCGGNAMDAPADSAVYFSPGRMAGDTFKVRAVVDLDEALDVLDEAAPDAAPSARRSNLVKIVVWRRVPIVGNWIVGATTTPVSIPPLTVEYQRAAMLIEPAPGVVPTDVGPGWLREYQAVVDERAAIGTQFVDKALKRDPGGYPVQFIDFMDYWEKANPDAGFFGKLWERIKTFFGGADERAYKEKCDQLWLDVIVKVTRRIPIPENGITAIKFGTEGPHNQNPRTSFTAGVAPAIPGATSRTRAIFYQFTHGPDTKTFIHEVGHTLFLAHAPGHFAPPKQPDGYNPAAHDKDQICLMSYHTDKRFLCGLCLLKLGGRDCKRVNNDGTLVP